MSWKYLKKSVPSQGRLYELLRYPVVTEKATLAGQFNQVVFKVAPDATKPDIKMAVETLFKVKVKAVNTLIQKGHKRRFRGRLGYCSGYKKAVVTLEEGHSIDMMAGL